MQLSSRVRSGQACLPDILSLTTRSTIVPQVVDAQASIVKQWSQLPAGNSGDATKANRMWVSTTVLWWLVCAGNLSVLWSERSVGAWGDRH
jgi:hypothetical protein